MKLNILPILSMSICSIGFLTAGTHSAEAKCGAIFKPQATIEKNYEGEFEPELRFSFEIPLGDSCKEERMKAEERRQDAIDQRIRNLERLVKLCNTADLPVCETLDELSMEIFNE